MLDLTLIEDEIAALEDDETTMEVCEQLAWLYIVRDHLQAARVSTSTVIPDSEFTIAASHIPNVALIAIMDDLMDTVKTISPKAYASVMSRIRSIHDPHYPQY